MNDPSSSSALKWLGPLATPILITLSILALLVTFRSYAETIGWKIISSVVFLVSAVWAVWYLRATTIQDAQLAGVEARSVHRHQHKWWRRAAYALPVVTAVLCGAAFLQPREIDYSSLLQGGGPYSPMVVFDSTPRGAEVRVAKSYVADDDPWLLSNDEDKVFRLPEHTLRRTRLWQGHYWVVFNLNGKRLQKYVIVQGPTVVKVQF
jgi:hypothetical protein